MTNIQDLIVERGIVSPRDLDQAALVRRQVGGSLEAALVRLGAIGEVELIKFTSEVSGIPLLTEELVPARGDCRQAAAQLHIPQDWLRQHQVAIWFTQAEGCDEIAIASARLPDSELLEAADQWSEVPPRFHLATAAMIEQLLYDDEPVQDEAETIGAERLREMAEEAPAIDFVNAMLSEAVARSASDIHVEPFEDRLIVRLRVDGVLSEWRSAPRSSLDAISSRLKLLSGMDIAERRLPQDGRQSIRIAGHLADVRVSSLPTSWGESIVLRFLGSAASLPSLSELGLSGAAAGKLRDLIERPHGIILITGPTGSGKTTTVYRLLSHLNDGKRKIVTVEDPVEMNLPGILQTAVRDDIGLSFAAGLRSILRQDPDVILVGEIRDAETASIAVQAALTGHLVISTLHTNSAAAAVTRLLDLGVPPFLLAEVVRGLVGQRLVRRLCASCSEPAEPSKGQEVAAQIFDQRLLEGDANWREAVGCPACAQSGYRGRVGVFEVAVVGAELQSAIRENADEQSLVTLARTRGFQSMAEDALDKAKIGLTSVSEIVRIINTADGEFR